MLRLDAVSKSYNERRVLHNISLRLAPGSLTLAAGPNGAGKSTLLHIMGGLSKPDSGTVEHEAAPGSIGYLGHDSLAYPNLTALENLRFWCSLHNVPSDEERLMAALSRFGLAAFADDAAGAFSRGMAQRLSLARLFLLSPALVLLDEPMSGLDVSSAAVARRELLALRDGGATLVWVTHDVRRDLADADAAVFLHGDGGYSFFTRDGFSGIPDELAQPGLGENAPC